MDIPKNIQSLAIVKERDKYLLNIVLRDPDGYEVTLISEYLDTPIIEFVKKNNIQGSCSEDKIIDELFLDLKLGFKRHDPIYKMIVTNRPSKTMTMEEIEEALGGRYKIKISEES